MVIRRVADILFVGLALALNGCATLPIATPPVTEASNAQLAGSVGGHDAVAARQQPTPTTTPAPTPTAQPTPRKIALEVPYDAIPMAVLVRINDWRVSQGLWPLKVNTQLTRLAQAQADYLAGLPDFPDDPHAGPTGENPKQRATGIGWPSYNTPNQVAADEVAYTGFSPESAVAWWQGSPIHAQTLTQTAYREIGVAVADKGSGHIFVADVGSRPNEVPVLFNPADQVWYISSEEYRWATGDRLQQVKQIAFLSDPLAAVTSSAWRAYQTRIDGADPGDTQAVALTDNTHTVILPITLSTDIAWLTSDAAMTDIAVMPGVDKPTGTALTQEPTKQSSAEPAQPTQAPGTPAEPANPTLTLVYGAVSMTLWHNPPGSRVDISGVALTSAGGQILATDFEGPWLGVPLKSFSVGSCLQTWPHSPDQGDPGVVAGCYVRASVVNLKAGGKFWLKGPFEVSNNGVKLRECPVGPATCGVAMP